MAVQEVHREALGCGRGPKFLSILRGRWPWGTKRTLANPQLLEGQEGREEFFLLGSSSLEEERGREKGWLEECQGRKGVLQAHKHLTIKPLGLPVLEPGECTCINQTYS